MTDGKGEGKGRSRGGGLMSSVGSSNNGKRRPYALLLILALGAAVLSVVILQKMRERRVFGILLQERDSQLLSLQLLLEVIHPLSITLSLSLSLSPSLSFSNRINVKLCSFSPLEAISLFLRGV
jgi:hypothetical protein